MSPSRPPFGRARQSTARGPTERKAIDCLFATSSLVRQQSLHRDRDFDPLEDVLGLQVVHASRHAANQTTAGTSYIPSRPLGDAKFSSASAPDPNYLKSSAVAVVRLNRFPSSLTPSGKNGCCKPCL